MSIFGRKTWLDKDPCGFLECSPSLSRGFLQLLAFENILVLVLGFSRFYS